jgi:hypothetical protein
MTRRTLAFLLTMAVCSMGAEAIGHAQVSVTKRTLLLQARAVSVIFTLGPAPNETYGSDTLLVYTDGFTVRNTVISNLALREPFVSYLQQGVSPAAFATLVQAISSNQIGLQSGNCRVDPVTADPPRLSGLPEQAPAGDSFDEPGISVISWYGRHGRTNSLKIGDSFTTECAVEVKNILLAVGAYEAAAFPLPPPG